MFLPPLNLSDWPLYWGAQQSSADDDLDEEHNKDGTYHCIFPSVGVEGAAGVSVVARILHKRMGA